MKWSCPPIPSLRTLVTPPGPDVRPPPHWPAGLALMMVSGTAYLGLGLVGFLHLAVNSGLLFSALWLAPLRCWPWVFAGTVLARSLGGVIVHEGSGIEGGFLGYWSGPAQYVLGNVLEPLLVATGVLLLRRWQVTPHTPASLQQILRVQVAALLASVAVMAKDVMYVVNDGMVGDVRDGRIVDVVQLVPGDSQTVLLLFAIKSLMGTFIGILLMAPLLAWVVHAPHRRGSRPILRDAALVLLPVGGVFLLWVSSHPDVQLVEVVRRMLLVGVVVFAVLHGWRGAVIALLLLSATTTLESHLFVGWMDPRRMQLFTAVTGATALLFGATVDGLRAQAGQLQQAKEESERLALELNAAARRNLLTEERERRRLAGELHDEFGQTLTALQTRLMLVAPQLGQGGQGAAVESLLELTRAMRANISGVLESLRPSALEQLGLFRAIDQGQVRRLADDAGLQLDTVLEGDARLLPLLDDTLRIAAYRLVQEGVTNVVRHARATRCRVRLRANQRAGMLWLFIEVRDDGIGVRVGRGPGRGLANMRDRVLALGGRLHVGSHREGLRLHALLRQPLELPPPTG
jgi:two-component system sensor histidine kinase UhpB